MSQCRHRREGIVTTHPDGLPRSDEAHAAASTCSRPECIDAAKRWVAGQANRTAYYRADDPR
jgi:hypothetical protein